MANKVDWRKIKAEYIRDPSTSHRSLAAKYCVSETIVSKRASAEGWAKARRDYSEKVVQAMLDEGARADAQTLARFSNAAVSALEKVEAALSDKDQFYRYLVDPNKDEAEAGQTKAERVYKKMDTKALHELSSTLKELVGIFRNVNGVPEWGDKISAHIALQKLELERARDAAENSDADRHITVVFEDPNGEGGEVYGS